MIIVNLRKSDISLHMDIFPYLTERQYENNLPN